MSAATPVPLRPGARSARNPAPESGNGKNVAPRPGNRRNFNLEPARRQRWNAARIHKVKFACALWSGQPQKAAAVQAGYKDGAGLEATASHLTRDPIVIAELERLAGEERERAHRARAKRTKYTQGKKAQTPSAADPAVVSSSVKANGNGERPAVLGSARETPPSFAKAPAPRNEAGRLGLNRVEGVPMGRRPLI